MSDQKSVGSAGAATSKTGRKGDPRMHRAVRARVNNPKLSLYAALKAGGFEYPTDDDSSCIDSENVSLGQRKNQLSRRVRLARKHGQQPSPSHQSQSEFSPQQQQLQSLFAQHNKQLTGTKHTLLDEDQFNEEPVMEDTTDRARLMAKFHPQYHPIIVPRAGTSTTAGPQGLHHSHTSGPQQQAQPPVPSNFGLRNIGSQVQQQSKDPPAPQLMSQILPSPSPAPQLKRPASTQNQSQAAAPQTISSGVALASLQQTASSVGLTLEQLALSLQSSATLSKVLLTDGNSTFKDHQDLALALYQSENKALYQKSMLLAGYQPDDTREGSSRYLQFALAAWQSEGKRLDDLVASRNSDDAPVEAKTGPPSSGPGSHLNHKHYGGPSQSSQDHGHSEHSSSHSGHQSNGSHHGHQHRSDHHQRHQASHATQDQHHHDHHDQHSHHHDHDNSEAGCCDVQGRHIHRLEGKCGHKAILHQPQEGPAHIDFVVGDTVECYHGVQPLQQQNSTNTSVWPSRFKCEDLSCPSSCTDSALDDHKHTSECSKIPDPKIINLQDIQLGGKEWNVDFTNDETLLGLFKLHETMTPRDLLGDAV